MSTSSRHGVDYFRSSIYVFLHEEKWLIAEQEAFVEPEQSPSVRDTRPLSFPMRVWRSADRLTSILPISQQQRVATRAGSVQYKIPS